MIFLKGAFSNKFYRKKRRGFFKDFFGRLRRAEKSSAKQERNCGGRKRKVRTAAIRANLAQEARCKRYNRSGDTTPPSKPTVLPPPLTQGRQEVRSIGAVRDLHRGRGVNAITGQGIQPLRHASAIPLAASMRRFAPLPLTAHASAYAILAFADGGSRNSSLHPPPEALGISTLTQGRREARYNPSVRTLHRGGENARRCREANLARSAVFKKAQPHGRYKSHKHKATKN